MVDAEIRSIHGLASNLNDRIMAEKSGASDTVRTGWLTFWKEWLAWRQENKGKTLVWSGTWDKVQEYKRRTNEWLGVAAGLGQGQGLSPLPKAAKGFLASLSDAAWPVAILVGLYLFSKR